MHDFMSEESEGDDGLVYLESGKLDWSSSIGIIKARLDKGKAHMGGGPEGTQSDLGWEEEALRESKLDLFRRRAEIKAMKKEAQLRYSGKTHWSPEEGGEGAQEGSYCVGGYAGPEMQQWIGDPKFDCLPWVAQRMLPMTQPGYPHGWETGSKKRKMEISMFTERVKTYGDLVEGVWGQEGHGQQLMLESGSQNQEGGEKIGPDGQGNRSGRNKPGTKRGARNSRRRQKSTSAKVHMTGVAGLDVPPMVDK